MNHSEVEINQSENGASLLHSPDMVEQNILCLRAYIRDLNISRSSERTLVEALREWLRPIPRVQMHELILQALLESRDPRAVIPLLEFVAMWGEIPEMIDQLGDFGEAAVLPALEAFQAENAKVRQYAVQLLDRLREDRGFTSIVQALKDTDKGVRHSAVLALSAFAHQPILSLIIESLQDKDEMVRCAATSVLSYPIFRGEERAVEALLAVRSDPSVQVRGRTIIALCEHREARTIPVFLEAMHDAHQYIRSSAARALGEIRETMAIPLLIGALKDPEWTVRESAGKALLQFGDKDALAIALLTDSQLSTSAKLNALTDLVNIRFRFNEIHLDYRSYSAEHYCQELLQKEIMPPVKEAIRAVQEEIVARQDRQILLRASDASTQAQELLRAAEKRYSISRPEEMLLASEKAEDTPAYRPSWLVRLFKRRH